MAEFMVTAPDGRKLKLTGDAPPTDKELDEIFANLPQKEVSFADKAVGVAENVLSTGTSAISGLAGGLSYLGALGATGDEQAAQAVKSGVEQELTYQPRTETGQQYQQNIAGFIQPIAEGIEEFSQKQGEQEFQRSGSPLSSTIEYMAPRVLLEAASFLTGGALAKFSRAKSAKAKKAGDKLNIINADELADENYALAVKTIQDANPEDLARLIDADPQIINAIDELNLDVEPLTSYYSKNPQFRAIEQGLASVDGQQLNIQQKNFIGSLSKKADDIIQQYGGTTDTSMLSKNLKNDMVKTADDLFEQEGELYQQIFTIMPKQTKVKPENTLGYIENLAVDVGGVDKLDPAIRSLYNKLKDKPKFEKGAYNYATGARDKVLVDEGLPAYGFVENQRKLIGQQLGRKGDTPFKQAEIGHLKALYAALKRDQAAVLNNTDNPSISGLQATADTLTKQRKLLEEQSSNLFGKELKNNAVNLVSTRIKGLAKQETEQFFDTLKQIPENRRGDVVLSAMNEVWKGTAASKAQLGEAQFARFWTNLNRSPSAKKALMDALPPESRQAIENLAKVNHSVYKANQDRITTGRIDKFFEDQGGAINRLAEGLIGGTKVGRLADVAGSTITKPILDKSVKELLKNSTDRAKAANELLADTKFKRLVLEAVKSDVNMGKPLNPRLKVIERNYMKSKKFEKWADTLDKAERDRVISLGVVNYLLNPLSDSENNTGKKYEQQIN